MLHKKSCCIKTQLTKTQLTKTHLPRLLFCNRTKVRLQIASRLNTYGSENHIGPQSLRTRGSVGAFLRRAFSGWSTAILLAVNGPEKCSQEAVERHFGGRCGASCVCAPAHHGKCIFYKNTFIMVSLPGFGGRHNWPKAGHNHYAHTHDDTRARNAVLPQAKKRPKPPRSKTHFCVLGKRTFFKKVQDHGDRQPKLTIPTVWMP